MLDRYYRELLSFLARSVRDRDLAADLAQESCVRVLALQQSGTLVADPRALLYRIARNLVVDRHRRNAVRGTPLSSDEDAPDVEAVAAPSACQPEVAAMSAERVETLLAAVDALPPRCREAFVLYKFDGLSYGEIGQRMGISVRTVEMHLKHAMDACWQCLERHDPDLDPDVGRGRRRRGHGRRR
jgi:RNA polymerase sigma factor (sigma-70 family)